MSLDFREVLSQLLRVTDAAGLNRVLQSLGDSGESTIGQPFGPHGLAWVPFGNNPSNISTIGLATKPGKSLSERLTNAMDALLEDRAQTQTASLPTSPRAAAEAWFGRPLTGPDSGLYKGITVPTDKRISVVLLPSGAEASPTVDVIDDGIGIRPQDLPTTILSLQAGNKITKRYQIGAFGQGGSSTLGFADYVIVVSRHSRDPSKAAFTLIRVLKLDASYKEDCYAYLTDGAGGVLVADVGDVALELYSEAGSLNPPTLAAGTLVRHIAYRLGGIAKALGPSPGNLYHYLHYTLFDPLLPFRIWDLRTGASGRSEYVGGSRNRLMRLAGEAGGNVQVRHYRPMEYVVPSGADVPCIGIEYWVILAYRKQGENETALRGNSAELFVQSGHPIVGTMNGQTQGELTGSLLKEVGLGLLARHVVVHIDASAADSRIRRELFSTSREGFKDGPVLESLVATLKRMLEEDQELAAIEQELTERLAKRDTASTREEVKQQVARLLREAGLQVSDPAKADIPGSGETRKLPREKRKAYRKADPLATLPFPQATFLRVAVPADCLRVALQDSEIVLVETDADAEFDRRGLIAVKASGGQLEVESRSLLNGGRIRWRFRPIEGAKVGATGEVRITLTKPDGDQLVATVPYEIKPAREKPSKAGRTVVPPFEIVAITPENVEQWETLWPDDGDDEQKHATHAYKAIEHSGKTWVYYSTVFPPYLQALDRLKSTKPELVPAFSTAYEIWIAYHAILQSQADDVAQCSADEEEIEKILDQQRLVVATMQVKQATQYAELWKRALASGAADGI